MLSCVVFIFGQKLFRACVVYLILCRIRINWSCLLSAGWSRISKSGTILIVLKNVYEERLPKAISKACCMYIQIDFRSFGETGLIVFIISSSRISVRAKGVLKGGTDHTSRLDIWIFHAYLHGLITVYCQGLLGVSYIC